MSRLFLGLFKPTRQGGWEGRVRTLTINAPLCFAPNDNRVNSNAPFYRVFVGATRVGDAWAALWGEDSRVFYRVALDDPFLSAPIFAALFPDEDDLSAQLVWTRSLKADLASFSAGASDEA